MAGLCDPKLKPSGQTAVPDEVTQTGITRACTRANKGKKVVQLRLFSLFVRASDFRSVRLQSGFPDQRLPRCLWVSRQPGLRHDERGQHRLYRNQHLRLLSRQRLKVRALGAVYVGQESLSAQTIMTHCLHHWKAQVELAEAEKFKGSVLCKLWGNRNR